VKAKNKLIRKQSHARLMQVSALCSTHAFYRSKATALRSTESVLRYTVMAWSYLHCVVPLKWCSVWKSSTTQNESTYRLMNSR